MEWAQELQQYLESIEGNLCSIEDENQRQETKLYWTMVKMKNNQSCFQKTDIDGIHSLLQMLEKLKTKNKALLQLLSDVKSDIAQMIAGQERREDTDRIGIVVGKIGIFHQEMYACMDEREEYQEFLDEYRECLQKRIPQQKITWAKKIKIMLKERMYG